GSAEEPPVRPGAAPRHHRSRGGAAPPAPAWNAAKRARHSGNGTADGLRPRV
ncbi:MAG: hypothetical protein AVDCRST_MAG19-2619, partial [uncultured Thermomicrobiales bacterium]